MITLIAMIVIINHGVEDNRDLTSYLAGTVFIDIVGIIATAIVVYHVL